MGTARRRAAQGRGERPREGTRAHCRARPALCPSLAADGLSRRPHVALLPRRYAAAPRRLTRAFRTLEPSFPLRRAGLRARAGASSGAAGPGPLSQASWVHAGARHVRRGSLAQPGRACPRVCAESGECIHIDSPVKGASACGRV